MTDYVLDRLVEAGNTFTPNSASKLKGDYADHPSVDHLEHLHDDRLVWPPQVQGLAPLDRYSRQLRDCVCRGLFPGAGESHRPLPIQRCPIENHLGSDYPGRVLHLLGGLSEGRVEMELSGWFCHDDRCRVRHF